MAKLKEKKSSSTSERFLWWLGTLSRGRFWYLATRMDVRFLNAVNVFFHSVFSMVILGIAAHLTSWPLIFPSLGPTIFLLFYAPSSPMAAPKNAVLAHLMGAATGWLCYTGLIWLYPSASSAALTEPARITTAALALGVCGVFMSISGIVHPPAASTTLIAGMGLLNGPESIVMVSAAVFFICMQAWTMHRIAGIRYPFWAPASQNNGPEIETRLGRLAAGNRGSKDNAVQDVAARLAARQKLK